MGVDKYKGLHLSIIALLHQCVVPLFHAETDATELQHL